MFQFIKKEKRKPKPIPWNFLGTKINEFLLEPTVRPTLVRPTQPSDLEIPTKLTNGHFLPFPSFKSFLCLYECKNIPTRSPMALTLYTCNDQVWVFFLVILGGFEKNNEMKNIENPLAIIWPKSIRVE
jgi:hypothetical protein